MPRPSQLQPFDYHQFPPSFRSVTGHLRCELEDCTSLRSCRRAALLVSIDHLGNQAVEGCKRHIPIITYAYLSSHNHGSVENWCISNVSFLSFGVIFHWTMIMGERWRKGRFRPISTVGPCDFTIGNQNLQWLGDEHRVTVVLSSSPNTAGWKDPTNWYMSNGMVGFSRPTISTQRLGETHWE